MIDMTDLGASSKLLETEFLEFQSLYEYSSLSERLLF